MLKIAAQLLLVYYSSSALAQDPSRTASASLLQAARAKGYTFVIQDFKVLYDPKWVSEAKTSVAFALSDIKLNGKRIDVRDDKTAPDRLRQLDLQFNEACKNMLDLSGVDIPGAVVKSRGYEYSADNQIVALECVMIFPAR